MYEWIIRIIIAFVFFFLGLLTTCLFSVSKINGLEEQVSFWKNQSERFLKLVSNEDLE